MIGSQFCDKKNFQTEDIDLESCLVELNLDAIYSKDSYAF